LIGDPVAFELDVLAAVVVALLELAAGALALDELLLELPQPAATSATHPSVSDRAFSLMSLSSCASTSPRLRGAEA
jgi:hypothetical protein